MLEIKLVNWVIKGSVLKIPVNQPCEMGVVEKVELNLDTKNIDLSGFDLFRESWWYGAKVGL